MTRDEEIEARAWEMFTQPGSIYSMDQCLINCEAALYELDRWRSSRAASAPEKTTPTPTPRIEVLKRWLECCVELGCDGAVAIQGPDDVFSPLGRNGDFTWKPPTVTNEEYAILRQYAATLKAQQAQEKSDAS